MANENRPDHKQTPTTGERLRGRLTAMRFSTRGYAFLSVGPGLEEVFIHRSDLPAEHWVRGALIEFTLLSPKPGTRNPRAGDPKLVRLPSHQEP